MPEKILAELSPYNNLMLAINAVCCIVLLYFHLKKNKIKVSSKVTNAVSNTASKLHLSGKSTKQPVGQQAKQPVGQQPANKSNQKSKKPKKNLAWGVVNSHNMEANPREPIYQIYSVY